MPGMKLANKYHERGLMPTHRGGNVLDLVLVEKDITINKVKVEKPCTGSSDHAMITVRLQSPGGRRPLAPLRWKPKKDIDWKMVE